MAEQGIYTWLSPAKGEGVSLTPLSRRAEQPVNDQTEPEINHHSKIDAKRPVPRDER